MKYYIAKTISGDFASVADRAIESLREEGFGVLTDIDVKTTMKKKLVPKLSHPRRMQSFAGASSTDSRR